MGLISGLAKGIGRHQEHCRPGLQTDWEASTITGDFLVGGIPTPLKNMTSSVGIIIPNIWTNKIHVPNHQPDG
jgi:hypothetical protein